MVPKNPPAKYNMFCIWSQIKQKASMNNSTPDQEIISTEMPQLKKKQKKHMQQKGDMSV